MQTQSIKPNLECTHVESTVGPMVSARAGASLGKERCAAVTTSFDEHSFGELEHEVSARF